MIRARLPITALVLALLAAGCDRGAPDLQEEEYRPPVTFAAGAAFVITATDTFPLSVEIAEGHEQRSFGLMERGQLPENAGMIFLYDSEQPASAGFWMYRTRIPLDIAYFDGGGTIVALMAMDPCPYADPVRCPTYTPGVPYHGALEVNRGWFAGRGAGIGDRVVLQR
jgi:uncharacterized protein